MASAQQFWVDFTEGDLNLLQTQLYNFVHFVGEEKYGDNYIMGVLAQENISQLISNISDGMGVFCLDDLYGYFENKYILDGFEVYLQEINWNVQTHKPIGWDYDEGFNQYVASEFQCTNVYGQTDEHGGELSFSKQATGNLSTTQFKQYLVDFSMYHDTEEVKFQLRDFIEEAGKRKYLNYQLSPSIDIQIYDFMSRWKYAQDTDYIILGPDDLAYHFKDDFIIEAFKENYNDIKWMDSELLYDPHNYDIDFSVQGDEAQNELWQAICGFIHHEKKYWGLSKSQLDMVYDNLGHAILSKRFNKHTAYVFSSLEDLQDWVCHDVVLESFVRYFRSIRWASFAMKFVQNGAAKTILIDFGNNDLEELREELDSFATRAGREFYDPEYARSATIESQIDQLLDPVYYGQTREHTIQQPVDLARFFNQKFMHNAAHTYSNLIIWRADDVDTPYKVLPHDYFTRPQDPPLERISEMSILIEEVSWSVTPSHRKLLMQQQLFSLIDSMSAVTSPAQVIPPIYAMESQGNWSKATLVANVQGIKPYKTSVDFPSWINDSMTVGFAGERMGLRTFLHQPEHGRFNENDYLTAQNSVYYLVIYVPEYEARRSWPFSGREPSPYQIYIGEASNGVLDRWIDQRYAHCRVTKRLLNHHVLQKSLGNGFSAYEPGPNDTNAQLPQCLLALAKVNCYRTALFVLKSCHSIEQMHTMEQHLIDSHQARDMARGLNQK